MTAERKQTPREAITRIKELTWCADVDTDETLQEIRSICEEQLAVAKGDPLPTETCVACEQGFQASVLDVCACGQPLCPRCEPHCADPVQ